jgi:hypothetical protein
MLKHFALAGFAIAVATSAQAMPRATLQADSVITQVRQGCGIGMVLVDGRCVSRHDLRVERRTGRRDYDGAYDSTAANTGDNCYRAWDQDARNNKLMPCSSGSPAYVDTPGVRAIVRARERLGAGSWYPYARSSGIVCMPGTTVTMGGQEHLCQ